MRLRTLISGHARALGLLCLLTFVLGCDMKDRATFQTAPEAKPGRERQRLVNVTVHWEETAEAIPMENEIRESLIREMSRVDWEAGTVRREWGKSGPCFLIRNHYADGTTEDLWLIKRNYLRDEATFMTWDFGYGKEIWEWMARR